MTKRTKRRPTDRDYVDNKTFTAAVVEHVEKIKQAEKKGLPKPHVTEYIGECILKIAQRTASRYNFKDYTFRDEMVSEGVISCLKAVDNFDIEKSKNAFSYYTTVCWWAFVRKINEEEKILYGKYTIAKEKLLHDLPEEDLINYNQKYGSDYSDEVMAEFMSKYERKQREKKEKTKQKTKKQKFQGLFDERHQK